MQKKQEQGAGNKTHRGKKGFGGSVRLGRVGRGGRADNADLEKGDRPSWEVRSDLCLILRVKGVP